MAGGIGKVESDPVGDLNVACEALRSFNRATIAGGLNTTAVYGALGALSELAIRLPQAYQQLATAIRELQTELRSDVEGIAACDAPAFAGGIAALMSAKHSAVAMHDAVALAHEKAGELIERGRQLSGRHPRSLTR